MESDNWARVKQIVNECLDLDAAGRKGHIARACGGDTSLVAEVESLLASYEQVGDFLETPALDAEHERIQKGRRIGNYQIRETIVQGGMGAVYKAVRADDQYHKEVAIKLIRTGFDSDFLVRRFKAERQILANLDHPNIARLLDGGSTEEGQPIDEYCDARKLSTVERLNLFRLVCSAVPNGLIHDWIGAVFIPNATVGSLLAVLHDYDRYKDIYQPAVTDSKCLELNAADQDFSMTWQHHVLFVNAAMQGQYRAHDIAIDSRRGYGVVDATRIQEIEDYGRPSERLLPADAGTGFIWRIRSISRYLERDGGVYLEIEAIALTRDIPSSLRWLVTPVVNHLSVSSLTTTLSQTREAVGSQRVTLAKNNRKGQN
jgi:hypothetical protein